MRGRWVPLLGLSRDFLLQFLLERFEIEARALLHRREIEEGLRCLCHLVLDEDEAPKLVGVPIVERQRSGETRALERIEAQVDEGRPVRLYRAAEPAARLI